MHGHVRHIQHVARAQRVPGVHDAVVAEGDADTGRLQLGHAREAAALGIGVVTALERDVDQWIGDRGDAGVGDEREQLADVVVVHAVHRGQVRAGDPAGEPSRCVSAARVSMWRECGSSVSSQCMSTIRPRFAASSHSSTTERCPSLHGALEMRDAADEIDAHVQGTLEIGARLGSGDRPSWGNATSCRSR